MRQSRVFILQVHNGAGLYTIHVDILAVRLFVEVVRYLTNLPGVTERECFSQDPLENYLGQLRACGGRSGNPTVRASLESAQSLKVAGHATSSRCIIEHSAAPRALLALDAFLVHYIR